MNDAITCSIHCISEAFISFPGVSKSQEDAPQVESTGEAKGWGAGVEEVSSASEYFSCVSSPLELIHSGKGSGLLGCGAPCVRGRGHVDMGEAKKKLKTISGDQGSVEEPGEIA